MLSFSKDLIKEGVVAENVKIRAFSYNFLGLISENCSTAFRQNIDEILTIASSGVMDDDPRVRFDSLTALALIADAISPEVQEKKG